MTRFLTLASAVILFAALASCLTHAQAHTPAKAPIKAQAPCSLLTPDEIKALAGTQVQPGQPGQPSQPGSNDCTWKDAKGQDRVFLSLRDPKGFHDLRDSMQATGRLVPITGLSGDAFFVSSAGNSAALYALKGSHVVLLTVDGVGFSKAQNEAAEKTLATQVLDKL